MHSSLSAAPGARLRPSWLEIPTLPRYYGPAWLLRFQIADSHHPSSKSPDYCPLSNTTLGLTLALGPLAHLIRTSIMLVTVIPVYCSFIHSTQLSLSKQALTALHCTARLIRPDETTPLFRRGKKEKKKKRHSLYLR
ncbi:hypothetical protein LZ32DRAFT_610931, partial [Colletotrichum eremochloae]